jgi:hypothetical protein
MAFSSDIDSSSTSSSKISSSTSCDDELSVIAGSSFFPSSTFLIENDFGLTLEIGFIFAGIVSETTSTLVFSGTYSGLSKRISRSCLGDSNHSKRLFFFFLIQTT